MTVFINREEGFATLYGGSHTRTRGRGGFTVTFRPRIPTDLLPDKVIRQQLYRLQVARLEEEAKENIARAEKNLWAASSLARHEVEDERMSQRHAGRASTLTAMIEKAA